MRGLGPLTSCVFIAAITASCAAATANLPISETGSDTGQSGFRLTITRTSYGSVSAQTAPGATCNASARLPSGRESTAQGLDTHNADSSGNITWTYRTVSNTSAGTGTYTVRCSSGGQTKTVTAPFTVQR